MAARAVEPFELSFLTPSLNSGPTRPVVTSQMSFTKYVPSPDGVSHAAPARTRESLGCCGLYRSRLSRPISLTETYQLGPLDKWKRFGIIPYRLVLHLLLIAAATYVGIIFNSVHGFDARAVGPAFEFSLFPDNWQRYSGDPADYPNLPYIIYTQHDFNFSVSTLAYRYFTLPENGLSRYEVYGSGGQGRTNATVAVPTVSLQRYKASADSMYDAGSDWNGDTEWITYPIHNISEVFPIRGGAVSGGNTLREVFNTAAQLVYRLPVNHWDPNEDDSLTVIHACQQLLLHVTYDFTNRGFIEVMTSLEFVGPCAKEHRFLAEIVVHAVEVCLVVIIALYEWLSWREVTAQLRVCRRLKHMQSVALESPPQLPPLHSPSPPPSPLRASSITRRARVNATWESLTFLQKAELSNPWLFVTTVGNVCLFGYCVEEFMYGVAYESFNGGKVALGLGIAFSWLSLVQFLQYTPGLYTMVRILKISGPRFLIVFISVLPIFIAFSLIALVVFGLFSARFVSWPRTFVALFAVVNGDAMRETFNHVEVVEPLWLSLFGDLFMYAFVCVLMYVGLNVLIAVNEDGYFKSHGQEPGLAHDVFSPPVKHLLLRLEEEEEEDGDASSKPKAL